MIPLGELIPRRELILACKVCRTASSCPVYRRAAPSLSVELPGIGLRKFRQIVKTNHEETATTATAHVTHHGADSGRVHNATTKNTENQGPTTICRVAKTATSQGVIDLTPEMPM
jgi:hypothetical protein